MGAESAEEERPGPEGQRASLGSSDIHGDGVRASKPSDAPWPSAYAYQIHKAEAQTCTTVANWTNG